MVERNSLEQTTYQYINVNYSFHEIKPGIIEACKFNFIIINSIYILFLYFGFLDAIAYLEPGLLVNDHCANFT